MSRAPTPQTRTLAGLLAARARSDHSEAPAIRFKEGDDFVEWSWAEYWDQAQAAAAGLWGHGVRPGDRVLMLVPDVMDGVRCIFGAWALGAVPIQVGVPYRLTNVMAFLDELRSLAASLEVKAMVVADQLAGFATGNEPVPLIPASTIAAGAPAVALPDPEDAFGPALLQLTSGSTGHSRGVIIPHERLTLHMAAMSEALPSHDDASAVSWLPLHHDMGLIGGLLFPFYNGFVAHMLSPLDFRARPISWLETMSRFRGSICAAPPSAYALCIRLADSAREAGLDLSSWECAMIGAEQISPKLLRRFADAFAPCGFRPEAFFPVYGLAEATVAVTFPVLLDKTHIDTIHRPTLEREGRALPCEAGPEALELTGCGAPIPRTELRIVDLEGRPGESEREVGEIQFRSESAMTGYFKDPVETEAVLDGDWIRTGDLGYLAEGRIYITGRKKELIIRAGHNLMPSVIEEIVGDVDGVRRGCVVAVGVRAERLETEKAWVVAETKRPADTHEALVVAIREALAARGVFVDRVLMVAPGSLPKTTSGKLKRRAVADDLTARAAAT